MSSDRLAEDVLRDVVEASRRGLGNRLVAAYALGSLAHGGFSPLVSDVDLGLVLADPLGPGDGETVQAIADTVKQGASPLHDRLSIFWGTPSTLGGHVEGGRFPPLDRLDLLEHGRLLLGDDIRGDTARPSPAELLIVGAEFALDFLAGRRTTASPRLGSMVPGEDATEEIPPAGTPHDPGPPADNQGHLVPGPLFVHRGDGTGGHERRRGGALHRSARLTRDGPGTGSPQLEDQWSGARRDIPR